MGPLTVTLLASDCSETNLILIFAQERDRCRLSVHREGHAMCMQQHQVGSPTPRVVWMSIGTGDRGEKEQDFLKKALALLNKVLNEEDREGQCEIVAVGSP